MKIFQYSKSTFENSTKAGAIENIKKDIPL